MGARGLAPGETPWNPIDTASTGGTGLPSLGDPILMAFAFLADKWGVFELNSANAPSFAELPPETQAEMLIQHIENQPDFGDPDAPEDYEGAGKLEKYADLAGALDNAGMLGQFADRIPDESLQFYNEFGPDQGGFDPFNPTNSGTPYLTEGQVQVYQEAIGELQQQVNAGEITLEQGVDAVSTILRDMGVPHDRGSLEMVGGGLSDNDGLISERWIITDDPSVAVGGGATPTAAEVLAGVGVGGDSGSGSGTPGGGSTGGDTSQPGNEEAWVYMGDVDGRGVFQNANTGAIEYYEPAVGNPGYVVGETYSGPVDDTVEPGTEVPGDGGGTGGLEPGWIWIDGEPVYVGDGDIDGDGSGDGTSGDDTGGSDDGGSSDTGDGTGTPGTGTGTTGGDTGGDGTGDLGDTVNDPPISPDEPTVPDTPDVPDGPTGPGDDIGPPDIPGGPGDGTGPGSGGGPGGDGEGPGGDGDFDFDFDLPGGSSGSGRYSIGKPPEPGDIKYFMDFGGENILPPTELGTLPDDSAPFDWYEQAQKRSRTGFAQGGIVGNDPEYEELLRMLGI